MKTNTNLEQGAIQTEELKMNGASLIFYTVKIIKPGLSDDQLNQLINQPSFTRVQLNNGYIERIFNLSSTIKNEYLIFSADDTFTLLPFEYNNGQYIHPHVKHYLTVYSKNILLVQSVIVFDRNNISHFTPITKIEESIDTDLILQFIHKISDKTDDWNRKITEHINKVVRAFVPCELKDSQIENKEEQSVSLQIWDIASIELKSGDEISGDELASRYELELSAILSCYNDHFSKDGLWKQQSANHVHRSVLSKTDILNDHQILLSERVCVEISQINHPELRKISSDRLITYGYDSTSIFLWGYMAIMDTGYTICERETSLLQDKLNNVDNYTGCEIRNISIEKQRIAKHIESYNRLKNICIEDRHKSFIVNGYKIKGLNEVYHRIDKVFHEIEELSRVFTGTETSELLKEMKELTKQNEKTSKTLSIFSSIVALLALIPLKDDVKDVLKCIITRDFSIGALWNILWMLIIITAIIFLILKNNKSK